MRGGSSIRQWNKLEAFNKKAEDKQDQAYEHEPECKGREESKNIDISKQAGQTENNCDPKRDGLRGSKLHLILLV